MIASHVHYSSIEVGWYVCLTAVCCLRFRSIADFALLPPGEIVVSTGLVRTDPVSRSLVQIANLGCQLGSYQDTGRPLVNVVNDGAIGGIILVREIDLQQNI